MQQLRVVGFWHGPGLSPLSHGLFHVINDTYTLRLGNDGWWSNGTRDAADLYFHTFGSAYMGALGTPTRFLGPPPLPPRAALGLWWSREWVYSEVIFLEVLQVVFLTRSACNANQAEARFAAKTGRDRAASWRLRRLVVRNPTR